MRANPLTMTRAAVLPRPIRAALVALVALVLGALMSTVVSLPAQAFVPTTLTVQLTSKTGAGLSAADGVSVTLKALNPSTLQLDPSVPDVVGQNDLYHPPGTWLFSNGYVHPLKTSQYYVLEFLGAPNSYPQYYGGTSFADEAHRFYFNSGDNIDVQASIDANVTISGKVTNSGGTGIKNQDVWAYRWNGSDWLLANADHPSRTSSTGSYSLTNLDPGSYKLYFFDCYYIDQACTVNQGYTDLYSGGAGSLASATAVYVPLGGSATVNQRLIAGGKLAGKITFQNDLYGPTVYGADAMIPIAYPLIPDGAGSYLGVDTSNAYYGPSTTTTGAWTIRGLPTGAYVVKFLNDGSYSADYELKEFYVSDNVSHLYADQFWYDAHVFQVKAGTTITRTQATRLPMLIDHPDPQLTITVDKNGGGTQSGAQVTVSSSDSEQFYFQGNTDPNGQVVIPRLPANSHYRIEIVDPNAKTTSPTGTVSFQPYIDPNYYYTGGTSRTITLDPIQYLAFSPGLGISPDPTLPGNRVVGQAFTALATANQANATISYSWLRNGVPIFGATHSSYTLQPGDVGTNVVANVVISKPGLPDYAETDQLYGLVQAGGQIQNLAVPTALGSGTIRPGSTLTATPGGWDIPGVTLHYAWSSDGGTNGVTWTPIADATSKTYTPTVAQAQSDVRVDVYASKSGYTDSASVSTNTLHVDLALAPKPIVTPKVTATSITTPLVGTRFTVPAVVLNVPGFTVHYHWYEDGVEVAFDDTPKVEIPSAIKGLIGLVISTDSATDVSDPRGYQDFSYSILVRKGSTGAALGGTPAAIYRSSPYGPVSSATTSVEPGVQLFFNPAPDWEYPNGDIGGTRTWQWYRKSGSLANAAISGATHSTYTTTNADIGAKISVVETSKEPQYYVKSASTTLAAGLVVPSGVLVNSVPTITIAGSGAIGSTAKAVVPSWAGVSGLGYKYQWYSCDPATAVPDCAVDVFNVTANYTPISGATAGSFVLPAGLAGKDVTVKVTASKKYYQSSFAVAGSALAVASDNTFAQLAAPGIASGLGAGAAHVGVKLTVKPGVYDVPSVVKTYVWQLCTDSAPNCGPTGPSWFDISPSATGPSYTPTAADLASVPYGIRVVETASRAGFSYTPPTATDPYPLLAGTYKVVTTPALTVSTSSFRVSSGAWSPAGTTGVQWFTDGGSVDSSTWVNPAIYPRSSSDGNKAIYAEVTHDGAAGYSPFVYTVVAQKGTITSVPGVSITNNTYTQTLSVNSSPFVYPGGGWGGLVPTTSYQWYANGYAISGARSSTFTPSSGYVGKSLKVRIVDSSKFYNTKTYYTPSIVLQGASFTASPGIQSTDAPDIRPGSVLTAFTDSYVPLSGVSFTYLWQKQVGGMGSWSNIPGGTHKTYTVTTADPSAHIRVQITAKKAGYNASVITPPEGVVEWSPPINSVTLPAISGAGIVGAALSLDQGIVDVAGVTVTQQWYRNGSPLPGVTGLGYTPLASSYDDDIHVVVTYKKAGYADQSVASNTVTVGLGAAPVPSTAPTIEFQDPNLGVQVEHLIPGYEMTATTYPVHSNPVTFDLSGLTFLYQWWRDPTGSGTFSQVSGATGPSFTIPTNESVGAVYRVTITVYRTGYQPYWVQVDTPPVSAQ